MRLGSLFKVSKFRTGRKRIWLCRRILRWEDHVATSIHAAEDISATEREALILARRGQGLFKRNVLKIERRCRITGVDRLEHLVASHCKPWRGCGSNQERLDGPP